MKRWHMWACGGLIAAGIVVSALGVVSPLILLMGAFCAVMMGGMGWMMFQMMRPGGGDKD